VRASSYRGTGKAAPAASNWSSPVVLQSLASDRRWRGCRVCSRGRGRGEQRGERKRGVGRGGAHFKGASDGEGMERGVRSGCHMARRWGRGMGASTVVGRQRVDADGRGRRGADACVRSAVGAWRRRLIGGPRRTVLGNYTS
jgi:hypothetical protein